eukprot:581838-Prymnesium_polylepis.1
MDSQARVWHSWILYCTQRSESCRSEAVSISNRWIRYAAPAVPRARDAVALGSAPLFPADCL